MKIKFSWLFLCLFIVTSLILVSCTAKETSTTGTTSTTASSVPATTTETPSATTATTAESHWWDKFGTPQYGGSLTLATNSFPSSFDPYVWMGLGSTCFDQLLCPDWTLEDRSIVLSAFIPDEYWKGYLAESWEFSDTSTLVLHIRQGVHWQNKAPVNGRELTADDIVFHYDRLLGTGSGFTRPNPAFSSFVASLQGVSAIDTYTVAIKFKNPTPPMNFLTMLDTNTQYVEAREWVEQGDTNNWEKNVGSGAWMISDLISGSSMTSIKNPDYWGYDERYPGNRLPYADSYTLVSIPDIATQLASLRTGKIDASWSLNLQQKTTLLQTNPEIQVAETHATPFIVLARNDTAPFNDIRVRQALDLSIDRNSIAKDYYGGNADSTPWGVIMQRFKGYSYQYTDWSQSLKDEYAFNPTKAKELLAEAGYPTGFKTNCVTPAFLDLQLLQLVKAYFTDIGVDMEIRSMDPAAANAFIMAKKQDQLDFWMAFPRPFQALDVFASWGQNRSTHHDANYDALVKNFINAKDLTEMKQASVLADRYAIENHLVGTRLPVYNFFHVWQPYLKGSSGEGLVGIPAPYYYARWWVDSSLKK